MESSHAVLEGLIELGESADDEVGDGADILIGLLLGVDVLVLFVCILLADAEQVVDCVFEDLGHLFGNELFLSLDNLSTSPPSSISYTNIILSFADQIRRYGWDDIWDMDLIFWT